MFTDITKLILKEVLEEATEQISYNGCNDHIIEVVKSGTTAEELIDFIMDYCEVIGIDDSECDDLINQVYKDGKVCLNDWLIMRYLMKKLDQM